jgi:nucleoside triphosphatase
VRQPEVIVGALLLNERGEVFVARLAQSAGQYAIPGGHLEYGERVAEALIRELAEETGLKATGYRLLRVGEGIRLPLYRDGTHHLVYLDFLVTSWDGALALDGTELSDGVWATPEAALELPLTSTTRQAIEFYLACGSDGYAYTPADPQ